MQHGDQEQSAPAHTRREPARWEGSEQDDTREVPHQRQAPLWRMSVLRRPRALRAVPSLSRFLRPAEPGDTRI